MTGQQFGSDTARPLDRVLRDPVLRSAIGYWDSLRGPRLVPSRMALDPAQIRQHLQNAAILEAPRPGTVRIRLAGARINMLMGMEVRGMPLRSLFDLADRGRITDATEQALATPSVLLVEAMAPAPRYGIGRADQLRTQIAILPMTDNDLATTRALYVMSDIEGDPGNTSDHCRWSIAALRQIRLEEDRPVLSGDATQIRTPVAARAPALETTHGVDDTPPAPEARGAFARARFRVIQGGLA